MNLPKAEIIRHFSKWLTAWNEHNLSGVLDFIHDDIMFENWDGNIITSKGALKKAWLPWFIRHGNFKFFLEDFFCDEQQQKLTFQWRLEWPSIETKFKNEKEIRRGVDIIQLKDGKVFRKITYSKTAIQVGAAMVEMHVL
ncbi:MAG: nuclear transport factor 2 family protein [Bacteroidetes bacterium]|nr:nuclear transport factor 2 family protein [Bacteroidota bacterium]